MKIHPDLQFGSGRRTPVLMQTEAAECGLACLAMVSHFYGDRVDMAILRSRHNISMKGMNGVQLLEVAARMNLSARPLRVELEALAELNLPAILHWNFQHFVVLTALRRGKFIIHDPARGRQILTLGEISKHMTGVAFEIEPTLNFVKGVQRQSIRLRGLLGRVRGIRRSLSQILLLAACLELFALVSPFLTQWIIDDALVSGDRNLLTVIICGVLFVGLIQSSLVFARSWILLYMSTSLNVQWVSNVLAHLLRLPVQYFEKRHIGDVISRFNATAVIQQTLTTTFVAGILDGVMAIITLILMFTYSSKLAFIALGAVIIYGTLRALRYEALRSASEGQIVLQARLQSHFIETVRGIQAIKIFNGQAERRARYLKMSIDAANAGVAVQRINLAFQTTNSILICIETTAILWVGGNNVLDRVLTVGMMIAVIAYKDQFTTRICNLVDKLVELKMLRLQGERLADIVLTKPEGDTYGALPNITDLTCGLVVDNVRYRYAETEPWVLDGVSFDVEPGESVVIVGPSGCGKTTLMKLMLGQLKPSDGQIKINGNTIEAYGLHQYRERIGVVMQDDALFSGSIAENISFFAENSDQRWIERCAKLAKIDTDISKMPMGYQTLLGEMGGALSGGQRQRILIARALYKRPQILFMDEATSHLDTFLEKEINESIAVLQITRIVIAHRPETIAAAGRIIRIGKVAKVAVK